MKSTFGLWALPPGVRDTMTWYTSLLQAAARVAKMIWYVRHWFPLCCGALCRRTLLALLLTASPVPATVSPLNPSKMTRLPNPSNNYYVVQESWILHTFGCLFVWASVLRNAGPLMPLPPPDYHTSGTEYSVLRLGLLFIRKQRKYSP